MIKSPILCSAYILCCAAAILSSQICRKTSQNEQCSSNSACDCLQITGAGVGIGICGYRWVTCSQLVACQPPNNNCEEPEHVCIHHPRCSNIPVCYPVTMTDSYICPSITNNATNSTITPTITTSTTITPTTTTNLLDIPYNATWAIYGMTIAGGREQGDALNQLMLPDALCLDDRDGTVFIADGYNDRIVAWKQVYSTKGRLVAGGNGRGNRMDQFSWAKGVVMDKENDSVIICDRSNRRVMRWSLRSSTTQGQIVIDNTDCSGLTMDKEGNLYVTDDKKHEVRRYGRGKKMGIVVAGGNGEGDHLNQLNRPENVFVNGEGAVYISDHLNHRVMKWVKGTTEGIIVAGGRGAGKDLAQVASPTGIFVDGMDTVYVAELGNSRVTRWRNGMNKGEIIAGGNGRGKGASQFDYPVDLSFDLHGHLYIVDQNNNRVQRFDIAKTS